MAHAAGDALRELLARRARYINHAISLCTIAALLVCLMIAILFISAFFSADVSRIVATCFVLSMAALITGLVSFLREVQLAMRSLRIGPH